MKRVKIAIRAPNWIGDAVLSMPAIRCLRKNFPEAALWVVARDWVKDVYASCDLIQGVIPLSEGNGLKSLKNSAQTLKDSRFDLGVLLPNSFASALLFLLARIPRRWGYARDGRGILLTRGVSLNPEEESSHQLKYYLRLMSGLGLETGEPDLFFPLTGEEKGAAKEFLLSLGLNMEQPVVILHPGASYGPAKRWPAGEFAALASLLQEKWGANILIAGASSEKELAAAVGSLMKNKPFNLAGQTSLRMLAGLISLSALFVSNDSGPMHLANALGTPVVALFGPTDPLITGPFQEPSAVIKKDVPCWPCRYRECPFDHRCLAGIPAEEVLPVCERFLR